MNFSNYQLIPGSFLTPITLCPYPFITVFPTQPHPFPEVSAQPEPSHEKNSLTLDDIDF